MTYYYLFGRVYPKYYPGRDIVVSKLVGWLYLKTAKGQVLWEESYKAIMPVVSK